MHKIITGKFHVIPSIPFLMVFFAGCLNVILSGAGIVFWPDSIGYTLPAADLLSGNDFTHWASRGFIYPMFVLIFSDLGRNLEYVVSVQKIMLCGIYGLGLFWIYQFYKAYGHLPKKIKTLYQVALFTLYSAFVFNGAPIALTHTIMPETLFSFFLALLCTGILALSNWHSKKIIYFFIFFGVVVSSLLPIIKPHFMLAAIIVPIGFIFFKWHEDKKVFFICFLGVLVALPFFFYEKKLVADYDSNIGVLFGPKSLFCNNADIISRTLKRSDNVEYSEVGIQLEKISNSGPNGWPLMGFNGDDCFYGSLGLKLATMHSGDIKNEKGFYIKSYLEAAFNSPGKVIRRIYKQNFFLLSNNLSPDFRQIDPYCDVLLKDFKIRPIYSRWKDQCVHYAATGISYYSIPYTLVQFLNKIILACVLLAIIVEIWIFKFGSTLIQRRLGSISTMAILIVLSVGLLISIAHTFDINRYLIMLHPLFMFTSFSCFVTVSRFFSKQIKDL